jgi:hypothetical protein
VLIHLGLHRTGTTTLQQRIFPRLPGVEFLSKPSLRDLRSLRMPRERALVISNEGLLMRNADGVLRRSQVRQLAQCFPEAQPLLTLRRPDRLLRSRYRYHVLKGDVRSFDEYVDCWRGLSYSACVELIREAFGVAPLVLFQEELEADLPAVAAWLGHRSGAVATPRLRRGPRWRNRSQPDEALRAVLGFNRRFPARRTARGAPRLLRNLRRGLMLALALAGPRGRAEDEPPLVDARGMARVRALWRADWLRALQLAAAQRSLWAPSLRREALALCWTAPLARILQTNPGDAENSFAPRIEKE